MRQHSTRRPDPPIGKSDWPRFLGLRYSSLGVIRKTETTSGWSASAWTTKALGPPPNQLAFWFSPTNIPGCCFPSPSSTQTAWPSLNSWAGSLNRVRLAAERSTPIITSKPCAQLCVQPPASKRTGGTSQHPSHANQPQMTPTGRHQNPRIGGSSPSSGIPVVIANAPLLTRAGIFAGGQRIGQLSSPRT
jgi:hypothetical protein